MGFFRKHESPPQFWEVAPLRTADPAVLYQHGIHCVTESDGPGMMATGWAIWDLTDISAHQSFDLLSDGYRAWQGSPRYSRAEAKQFLYAMFERLQPDRPAPWTNLYDVAPEVVMPIATYNSARCWAGSELVELLDDTDQVTLGPVIFDAIRRVRVEFVPPRSMAWAKSYAANHNQPEPWSTSAH
jgi:hypothetical protein